jgi:flagellin-like hook-associated protein FlgL
MSIGYIGSIPSTTLQSIIDMRARLDDLQRQLGSGQKATTYAGLGTDRGISLSLRGQLSALSRYDSTMQNVNVRMQVAQSALTGIDSIVHTVKQSTLQTKYTFDPNGKTEQQKSAFSQLDQMLALLNTRAGDHYLFSGKAVDTPAVVSADLLINGDATHAGLKQIIDERRQADIGANGLGRLDITAPTAQSVELTEQAASPFGFKLTAANSTLSNTTVTGPAGSPVALNVDFTGVPAAGEKITITLALPDGTSQDLVLTATANSPPAAGEFTIGADNIATAANFSAALSTSLTGLAQTKLTLASAQAASNDFMNTAGGGAPQRVDGPPFDTATDQIDGTSGNTVIWYLGEDDGSGARSTASARIDSSMAINYGMRANEDALRLVVQNVAKFAAMSFSASDPNSADNYEALAKQVSGVLDGAPGQPKVTDLEAAIAGAQTASSAAQARHAQTSNVLTDLLQKIEGVSQAQVGAQILSMQTNLQASLQTTAMLSKISLVNFL